MKLPPTFWFGLGLKAAPVLLVALGAILLIVFLKFLEKRRAWQAYVTFVLTSARRSLDQEMGERGRRVFDAWLDGLDEIKDGNLSRDDVLNILLEYARAVITRESTPMSPKEDTVVRATADTMVQMLSVKSVPTRKQAIQLLSTTR